MAYIVRMPKLGVEMESGELLEWHVDTDDPVEEGDLLAEIESEKTVAEVTAREDGALREVFMEPGDEGPPGSPMGIVAGPEESIDDLLAEADVEAGATDGTVSEETAEPDAGEPTETADEPGAPSSAPTDVRATPKARRRARELDVDLDAVGGTGPQGSITAADVEATARGEPTTGGTQATAASGTTAAQTGQSRGTLTVEGGTIKASPRSRRRADELGIDVTRVEGTGPQGSIVEADVERAAEAGTAPATPAEPTPTQQSTAAEGRTIREDRPQSRTRETIARRLGESWRTAPHVTVDRSVTAEPMFAAVEAASASGYDVSITDVLLRGISETLTDHPEFNATFEDDTLRIYEEQNVGIAVDAERGLVTPVVRDLGAKDVTEIAAARSELTDRALSGDLDPDDLSGGTFTVSNLGVFGVDSFTPIINPPEVAILGVNRIEERPVKGDRGGIRFQREISFSLSFDHRAVDGADAARFLDTLAERLQSAVELVP